MEQTRTKPGAPAVAKHYTQPAAERQILRTMKALQANGFKVVVVEDLQQLYDAVIKLIPAGAEVFTGTSRTLEEAGLTEALNNRPYKSVRAMFASYAGQPDKQVEMKRIGSASDYAVGSVHAITEDGQVVIASASGSQLPNYVYGARNFIWAVGSQKLVKDLDEAFDRIENHTLQLEDKRMQKAHGVHSSINKLLIYRKEPTGRGTIIIIREAVGF